MVESAGPSSVGAEPLRNDCDVPWLFPASTHPRYPISQSLYSLAESIPQLPTCKAVDYLPSFPVAVPVSDC